jgi:hypothetical protein
MRRIIIIILAISYVVKSQIDLGEDEAASSNLDSTDILAYSGEISGLN